VGAVDRVMKILAHAAIATVAFFLLEQSITTPGFRLLLDHLRGWHVVSAGFATSVSFHRSRPGILLVAVASVLAGWPYHRPDELTAILLPLLIGTLIGALPVLAHKEAV
jgi:hypothetical protein